MKDDGPLACVLGEIDLVSALGMAGVRCAVAAIPGDPAHYSRYVDESVPWFHPMDEPELMLQSLLRWGESRTQKPVLFYNGDHDLLLVSRERETLKRSFDFVVAPQSLVEDLVDKERFSELARRLDLPVPPNVCLDPDTTIPADIQLDYPIVVKPLMHRHEIWNPISGGAKAIEVTSSEALNALWPQLQGQGRIIAQTLIPGPETRVESYHVFVDEVGRIACEFTGRKIRTSPPEFGDTTALEITDAHDVATLGRELVDRLALTGVAKFDFKRDDTGQLWLLEVNPRFNLWHHPGAHAGANIPSAVYRRLTGRPEADCTARSGITWCHPTRDARAARAAGIGFTRWGRWAASCEAKWGGSIKDPMPFVRGVLVRRLGNKLGRG